MFMYDFLEKAQIRYKFNQMEQRIEGMIDEWDHS